MKLAFGITGLIFLGMYIGAEKTLTPPVHDGKVHLKWSTDLNPVRDVQIAKFEEMYPNDIVTIDPSANGDNSKVIVQCATGVGPDIMDTEADSMRSMVDAGVLLDLTPYAAARGFSPENTYHSIKGDLMYKGKQYRFPCNVDAACIIYNKQIFDDHGVPYPQPNWTEDDFIKAANGILHNPSKSGKTHIAYSPSGGVGYWHDQLLARGGSLFSPDGLWSRVNSKASVDGLQDYSDMLFKYHVIPTPADAASMSSQGGWGSGGMNWFYAGQSAMIPLGRWFICQLPNYPAITGHLGVVQVPRIGNRPSVVECDTRAAAINSKSSHWHEALNFLQYLASPQYSKIVVDSGDAMPPNPTVAASGQALVNDLVPDPAFHAPFVAATVSGKTMDDDSPFVDAAEVSRWQGDYIGKVENNLMTPQQAMDALAEQINQQIRLNLERRPDLQKEFEEQTGKTYTADWWKTITN
jgi:multiple sugar transport system substrate-binding protein